jgi:hypothetical protein
MTTKHLHDTILIYAQGECGYWKWLETIYHI